MINVSDTLIEVRDLHKSFGQHGIIDGMNFEVPENEITVLMGPNGVGKTILLCCLAGGLHADRGDVEVFGSDPWDVRHKMNFLLQEGSTLDNLSGRENVDFFTNLHPGTTDKWRDLVETFGIEDELDKLVRNYSGGMTRKLALSLTFGADVPLYLLDEPTAALDLSTIRTLHDVILQEKERGKTFVITSHTPLDAQIADRILFMLDGSIVEADVPETLLDSLPPVVRFTELGRREVEDHLLEGHLFRRGGSARAFLAPDSDIEQLRAETDGRVERDPPTYTDLFNYYTAIYAGEQHDSDTEPPITNPR